MISTLQDRSRRYLPHLYKAWEMVENSLEAHEPLLAAIRARDSELVEKLTRQHMNQAGDRLLGVLRVAAVRQAARASSRQPFDGPHPRGWRTPRTHQAADVLAADALARSDDASIDGGLAAVSRLNRGAVQPRTSAPSGGWRRGSADRRAGSDSVPDDPA